MDKPADPATPFGEVYQAFLDDLTLEGTKPRTIYPYIGAKGRVTSPPGCFDISVERSRNAHSESERSIGVRNRGNPPLGLHGDDSIRGLAGAPSNGSEERGAAIGHDA